MVLWGEKRTEAVGEVTTAVTSDGYAVAQQAADMHWLQRAAFSVIDQAPTEMALLDARGRIVHVNRAWIRFASENSGDPAKTAVGQDYLSVCRRAGTDGGDAYAAIRSVLDGRTTQASVEYPCHSPTQRRWFRLRCIRIDAGPAAAAVMHDDLTDHYLANEARKRLEQVAAKVAELEREERRTTQALNTIGHTLRTPLTPVRLHLATLARHDLPAGSEALVQKVRAATERLVDAVNEAVKAIELQRAPLRLIRMPADEAVARLREALHAQDALAHVTWQVDARGDIDMDVPLLAPALAALLRTAKAHDPTGQVRLAIALDGVARITVRHHAGVAPQPDDGMELTQYMCNVIARLHGGRFATARTRGEVVYRLDLGDASARTQ